MGIEPLYLHDWDKIEDLKKDFELTDSELSGVNIILASYTFIAYEGLAFVLFEKNGRLYEVNGSHCSCYELDGQWKPEEADLKELRNRIIKGGLGKGCGGKDLFASKLLNVISTLESKSY